MDANTLSLVSIAGSIIVQILGIMSINRLLTYRVEQLEKLVEKQGQVVDRVDSLEVKVTYNEKSLDALTKKVDSLT